MTTKEKIVRRAIAVNRKKIERIKYLLSANPVGRICELRIEAGKLLGKHGDDYATIAKLIKPLAEEEKLMLDIAEKQKDMAKLIESQVAIEHELYELGRELYYIEHHGR